MSLRLGSQPRTRPRRATLRCSAGIARKQSMPGFSEACVSGHHESCTDRDCRCLCPSHPWNHKLVTPPAPVQPAGLACPRCARVPRPGDQFCRADGEQLVSPQKCPCGAIGDKTDRFCGKCGKKLIEDSPEPTEDQAKALESWARTRPSDVEVPPTEVH